jgi:hypothetical protein
MSAVRVACELLVSLPRVPEAWFTPAFDADAETLLASGSRIKLACADISDLELVTGISDTLAHELLRKRATIIARARHAPYTEALTLARGVGEIKAKLLSRFISLEDACFQREPYLVRSSKSSLNPKGH